MIFILGVDFLKSCAYPPEVINNLHLKKTINLLSESKLTMNVKLLQKNNNNECKI